MESGVNSRLVHCLGEATAILIAPPCAVGLRTVGDALYQARLHEAQQVRVDGARRAPALLRQRADRHAPAEPEQTPARLPDVYAGLGEDRRAHRHDGATARADATLRADDHTLLSTTAPIVTPTASPHAARYASGALRRATV